jgi:hypothetical protein
LLGCEKIDARHVAARPGEARHKTDLDGVSMPLGPPSPSLSEGLPPLRALTFGQGPDAATWDTLLLGPLLEMSSIAGAVARPRPAGRIVPLRDGGRHLAPRYAVECAPGLRGGFDRLPGVSLAGWKAAISISNCAGAATTLTGCAETRPSSWVCRRMFSGFDIV